jgi:glycine cleavage system H protein
MEKPPASPRDMYYSYDHEWIDFQGSVAYIGVCAFKLKGIKHIHQLVFAEDPGLRKQGEVIASIQYEDYQVLVHMPIDGKVISINEALWLDNRSLLLEQPENNGWLALIVPHEPNERTGLLEPEQYTLLTKRKI